MQIVVALVLNEILRAAQDTSDPIRPVFIIIEEGHTFAPARESSISLPVIKKLFAEGPQVWCWRGHCESAAEQTG